MRVALDAMGGDKGARPAIEGALLAARKFNIDVLLVGRERDLLRLMKARGIDDNRLHIINAEDVIQMTDSPSQTLRRKKSSLAIATRLVKEGKADAMVSAGNTGAILAHTLLTWRALPGIKKPAIATFLPTRDNPIVVCDAGANVDSKAHQIVQFATMASVYAQDVLRRPHPRVGLLSNGSEENKGNEVTKLAHAELKVADLNFLGNVEANDVFSGEYDVVACDGFTGNILLKASEGIGVFVFDAIKKEIGKSFVNILGGLLARPAFKRVKRRTDYDEYGGAPLLGVKGIAIKAHGCSNSKAYMNALRVASECHKLNLVTRLDDELKRLDEAFNNSEGESSARIIEKDAVNGRSDTG